MTDTSTLCDQLAQWQTRAACQGADVGLFFPDRGGRNPLTKRAIAYCAECPVATDCLEDALGTPAIDDYGIRGGTTRAERLRIRAARQNTALHTYDGDH